MESSTLRAKLFAESVEIERLLQDRKWGPSADHSLEKWLTILTEEVGEFAKDILERRATGATLELIQVAAVCGKIAEMSELGPSLEEAKAVLEFRRDQETEEKAQCQRTSSK